MGQKTHPIGLRVGLWQRKWNNTWYASNVVYSKIFFAQHRIDSMLKQFFYSYSMTRTMFTNRALLVNSRFIKSNYNAGFLFIFFYKIREKKVSQKLMRLRKKTIKRKWKKMFNKALKKNKKKYNGKKKIYNAKFY